MAKRKQKKKAPEGEARSTEVFSDLERDFFASFDAGDAADDDGETEGVAEASEEAAAAVDPSLAATELEPARAEALPETAAAAPVVEPVAGAAAEAGAEIVAEVAAAPRAELAALPVDEALAPQVSHDPPPVPQSFVQEALPEALATGWGERHGAPAHGRITLGLEPAAPLPGVEVGDGAAFSVTSVDEALEALSAEDAAALPLPDDDELEDEEDEDEEEEALEAEIVAEEVAEEGDDLALDTFGKAPPPLPDEELYDDADLPLAAGVGAAPFEGEATPAPAGRPHASLPWADAPEDLAADLPDAPAMAPSAEAVAARGALTLAGVAQALLTATGPWDAVPAYPAPPAHPSPRPGLREGWTASAAQIEAEVPGLAAAEDQVDWLLEAGRAWLWSGAVEEASAAWTRAVEVREDAPAVLEALARLAASQMRHGEARRLWEHLALASADAPAQAAALLEAVLAGDLHGQDTLLDDLLALYPDHPVGRRIQRVRWARGGRFAELAEDLARGGGGPMDVGLSRALAGEQPGADLLAAAQADPQDPTALALAWRALSEPGMEAERARFTRARGEAASGLAASRWLQLAAGDLSAAGDVDDAASLLARARAADPEDRVLEWRLEASLARAGRWQELAEALAADGRPRSNGERAVRCARRAAVLLRHVGDPAGALESLERACDLVPGFKWASERRLELLEQQGRGDVLVEALLARADAATDASARASCLFEAAEVLERDLGRPEEAARAYEQAWRARPDLHALWAALRLGEQVGDWHKVASLLEDWGGDPSLAGPVSGLEIAGGIQEHRLGARGAALRCYLAAVAVPRPSLTAVRGVQRLLALEERWEELARSLEDIAERVAGPLASCLLYDAGRIRAERLGDREGAARLFGVVALGDAGFLPASWALRRLGFGQGASDAEAPSLMDRWATADVEPDWPALLSARVDEPGPGSLAWIAQGFALAAAGDEEGLITHLADVSSPWALWHRGWLLLGRGHNEAGVTALAAAAVQELEPTLIAELLWHPGLGHEALRAQARFRPRLSLALARFGLAAGAPDVDGWLAQAAEVDADRSASLILAAGRGEVWETTGRCLAVADASGGDDAVAWRWLAARHLASDGAFEEAVAALPGDVHGALAATVARDRLSWLAARPEALIAALEELGEPGQGWARRARAMELATWQEAVGATEDAAHTCQQLLDASPGFHPARVCLARLRARAEQWSEAAQVLEEHALQTTSEMLRAQLRERWEEIRATRLEDVAALEARLRRRMTGVDEDRLVAMGQLCELLETQGRWADLAALLGDEADRAQDPTARAGLLTRRAAILEERLDDLDGAYAAYQSALDAVEGDAAILAALHRLAARRGDWSGLVAVLARESLACPPERRLEIYREIASLWEDRLDDPEAAVASWEKVLEAAPGDEAALAALVRLHRRAQRWEPFVAVATTLARAHQEDVGLARDVGEALALQLGRATEALSWLDRAAAGGAFSREAYLAVADELEARGAFGEALGILRRVARQAQEVDDQSLAVTQWRKVEQIADARLRDAALVIEAREALARLLPEDPAAQHRLADSYHAAGMAAQTLETIDRLLAFDDYMAGLSTAERLEIHRRRARYLLEAGRQESALLELEAIVRLDPEDREAEGQLLTLYQQLGEWRACADHLASILERRKDELSDPDKVRMLLELGRSRRRAGQVDAAVAALEEVTRLAPNEVTAYQGLIVLRRDQEEWTRLLALYNQVIRCSTDPAQVVQAYVDKADILDERLGATDRSYVEKAAMHFEKALQFDRRNTYCMLRLAEIALRERAFAKAGTWLQTLFGSGPSMAYQARAHVLNGILAAEFQKDGGTAQGHFRRAATVAHLPADVVSGLSVEIQRSPGNLESLLALYAQIRGMGAPEASGS